MTYNQNSLQSLCNEWLPSWTGNNPDKLISFYSVDAFYRDPVMTKGLKGVDQILPYFKKLLAKNPNWIWTAQEIIPTEKGFTLKWLAKFPIPSGFHEEEGLDIVELNAE